MDQWKHDRIVTKSGILSKKEKKSAFIGIQSVSVRQSLWGRMFVYGDVSVDVTGKWDINTFCVIKPKELPEYLEGKIVKKSDVTTIMN